MYNIDSLDKVKELANVPLPSSGAPCPNIFSGEDELLLAYYIDNRNGNIALVRFSGCYAHFFGPPNDEAFSGHPLAERGLKPYSVSEVLESSWMRQLETMNAVHPFHSPQIFTSHHHFIFSFHDITFECIARTIFIAEHSGEPRSVIAMEIA